MTKEYKLVSFRRDYYNDITVQEIETLYAESGRLKTNAVISALVEFTVYSIYAAGSICCLVSLAKAKLSLADLLRAFLGNIEGFLTVVSSVVVVPVLFVGIITNLIRSLNECSDFYFAKGKIISLESEYNESDKKHKNGYYKNILTLAVSENEAVGNIFYFSENEWESEKYIGKSAIAVYYPKMHRMYAMIDGEDAENYRKIFKDKFRLDDKKPKGIKKYERRQTS